MGALEILFIIIISSSSSINVQWVYLASQNIPTAIALALGNKVVFYTLLRLSFPVMATTKWHISHVWLISLITNLQARLLAVSPTPGTDLGTVHSEKHSQISCFSLIHAMFAGAIGG